jgi:hypothetical protein
VTRLMTSGTSSSTRIRLKVAKISLTGISAGIVCGTRCGTLIPTLEKQRLSTGRWSSLAHLTVLPMKALTGSLSRGKNGSNSGKIMSRGLAILALTITMKVNSVTMDSMNILRIVASLVLKEATGVPASIEHTAALQTSRLLKAQASAFASPSAGMELIGKPTS